MRKARRKYVLKARAEKAAGTHARIVDAIMNLHSEIGPRATNISAIAKRAGVERLTVYRHFKDEEEMFDACSGRFMELNPPPTLDDWSSETEPAERTRRGLTAIFAFFSRTSAMWERVYRDVNEMAALAKVVGGFEAHMRNLAEDLASAWPNDARRGRRYTILRHCVKFPTWQSLEADAVSNEQKVALMIEWLAAPAVSAGKPPSASPVT